MNAIEKNVPQKLNRSAVIWKILNEVGMEMTCREIAYAAGMEDDTQNISATLSMFLKSKKVRNGKPRLCTISGKVTKTYIKTEQQVIPNKNIEINLKEKLVKEIDCNDFFITIEIINGKLKLEIKGKNFSKND